MLRRPCLPLPTHPRMHTLALRVPPLRPCLLRSYDDLRSAQDNIDLQSTILSRFDLIFIVKDPASEARDAQIATKVGSCSAHVCFLH